MYITLKTTFTSTCYILTNKCCTWLRMTRHINRRNLQEKKDREERGMKERKSEMVIIYMYITLLHLQVHVIYLPTSVALDWEWRGIWNRRNLQKERKTDRRKKERKKERKKVRQDSDKGGN